MAVKLLYTLVLCIGVLALAREIFHVWFDTSLYIGPFEYSGGSGADPGKTFGIEIIHAHMLLYSQLQTYNSRSNAASDKTFMLGDADRLNLPASALEDVSLTYQNVDISKLLTSLRRGLRQPNEISGLVIEGGGTVQASVNWPQAPAVSRSGMDGTAFTTEPRGTSLETARQVACRIAWPQLASRSREIADLGPTGFCRWAEALAVHAAMSVRTAGGAALNADGQEQVTQAIARLTALIATGATYIEIHRLRADLVDLLPAEKALPLQVQAQDDRLRYAIATRAELQQRPEAERKQIAFAIARPALAVSGGKFRDPLPDNWKALLEGRAAFIAQAAAATGFVKRTGGPEFLATAFRIAPDLIVTTGFALDRSSQPSDAEAAQQGQPPPSIRNLFFCEADDTRTDCPGDLRHAVTAVILDGVRHKSAMVVLKIEKGKRPAPRFLSLRAVDGERAKTVTDQYALVVGYPTFDARMPPAVMDELLGGASAAKRIDAGIKRVMPGRMLGMAAWGASTDEHIITDVNTAGGVAGGPLVDLTDGQVVGVHIGGLWKGAEGKFAYSAPFTNALLALIDQAVKAQDQGPLERRTP